MLVQVLSLYNAPTAAIKQRRREKKLTFMPTVKELGDLYTLPQNIKQPIYGHKVSTQQSNNA